MDYKELELIRYSQGWVEGRLEEDVAAVEEPGEKKHREEMLAAFLIVSNGFDKLRKEYDEVVRKLMTAKNVIG